MLTRVVVCALMMGARLAELRRSRQNVRVSGAASEGRWSRGTYPLMIALHAIVLLGTLLRGARSSRRGWLALLLVVQPLRLWVLLLLGNRWNTRGAVPRAFTAETRGPYAIIRHPNYLVVSIELIALPAAFDLTRLAACATLANAAILALRIRDEERALMAFSDYRSHFAGRARFIPRLF